MLKKLADDPRVTVRKSGDPYAPGKCVVYWMQRAQRGIDNPALNLAINVGNELRKPVVVFFAPVPFYPNANLRHYRFLAQGIPDIAEAVTKRQVGFVLRAFPNHHLVKFLDEVRASIVIGDENPMREPEAWRLRAARQIRVPLWTVDADVIVPSSLLKREHFGARTIRPRIREMLPQFLKGLDNPRAEIPWSAPCELESLSWDADFTQDWTLDRSVQGVPDWQGGTQAALKILNEFVKNSLEEYPVRRNHPEQDGSSCLSPYLHFGHIGPHSVARAVQKASASAVAKEAFLEQLIVRRELSINFVKYNPSYDSLEAIEPWADRSLAEHASDERPVLYSDKKLDNAETHDPLWNAAHKQMALTGWMHNYMRMYWAKKILEWSPSISAALQRAIRLNDRYELDGRDPNGYAGIAWAILGKHDRAWFDRPIFGKVRYMSLASTSKKFDSKRYIEEIAALERSHV